MKINVRHEAATEAGDPEGSEATPERTCIWTVDDNGETAKTAYLEPGQKVTMHATTSVAVEEPQPIEAAPPA